MTMAQPEPARYAPGGVHLSGGVLPPGTIAMFAVPEPRVEHYISGTHPAVRARNVELLRQALKRLEQDDV